MAISIQQEEAFYEAIIAAYHLEDSRQLFGEESAETQEAKLDYMRKVELYFARTRGVCEDDEGDYWERFCKASPDAPECRCYDI